MSGATVFRRNGPAWRFEWDLEKELYTHRTNRGTLYAIIGGVAIGKPFWIGRLHGNTWHTAEADIGADTIDFDSGGCFWFGRKAE
jgi:hypothetical protein